LKALSTIGPFQNIIYSNVSIPIYIFQDPNINLVLTSYEDRIVINIDPINTTRLSGIKITHSGPINQMVPILPDIVELIKRYSEFVELPPELRRCINIDPLVERILAVAYIETY
jgi:hypothetical protein